MDFTLIMVAQNFLVQMFLYRVVFASIHLNWMLILPYLNFGKTIRYSCQNIVPFSWWKSYKWIHKTVTECTSLMEAIALLFDNDINEFIRIISFVMILNVVCQIGSKGWFTAWLANTPTRHWFAWPPSCQKWKYLYASRNYYHFISFFLFYFLGKRT